MLSVVVSRFKHVKHLKWICTILKEHGSKNAAVLAVKILALSVENYHEKPYIFKKNREKKVAEGNPAIQCEKNLKFS